MLQFGSDSRGRVESAAHESAWKSLEPIQALSLDASSTDPAWVAAYQAASRANRGKSPLLEGEVLSAARQGHSAAVERWYARLAEHHGRKCAVITETAGAAVDALGVRELSSVELASRRAEIADSAMQTAQWANQGYPVASDQVLESIVNAILVQVGERTRTRECEARDAAAADAAAALEIEAARHAAEWQVAVRVAGDALVASAAAQLASAGAKDLEEEVEQLARQTVESAAPLLDASVRNILGDATLRDLQLDAVRTAVAVWRRRTAPDRAAADVARWISSASDKVGAASKSTADAVIAQRQRVEVVAAAADAAKPHCDAMDDESAARSAAAEVIAAYEDTLDRSLGEREVLVQAALDKAHARIRAEADRREVMAGWNELANGTADAVGKAIRSATDRVKMEAHRAAVAMEAGLAASRALPEARRSMLTQDESDGAYKAGREAAVAENERRGTPFESAALYDFSDTAIALAIKAWSLNSAGKARDDERVLTNAAFEAAAKVLRGSGGVFASSELRSSAFAAAERVANAQRPLGMSDDELTGIVYRATERALEAWAKEVQRTRLAKEVKTHESAYRAAWGRMQDCLEFALGDDVVADANRLAQKAAAAVNAIRPPLPEAQVHDIALAATADAVWDWGVLADQRLQEKAKEDRQVRKAARNGRVQGTEVGHAYGTAEQVYNSYKSQTPPHPPRGGGADGARQNCTYKGREVANYYELLEVSSRASSEVIKAAYKARMAKCHPDAGGNTEEAKQVNEARDVLLNAESRAEYDRENGF